MLCLRAFFVCAALLTVVYGQIEPVLEIQPNSGSVSKKVGSSLALTCKPHVQDTNLITQLEWRDTKSHVIDSTSRSGPVYVQKLTGDPGLILLFSKLAENQAGTYTCRANYANSEQIQASVNVTTYVDVTFVDAPESQYPRAGQDALIKCKVHGDPAPIVEWSKYDQAIVNGDRYVIHSDGLIIKNVKESDDGVYKCTALVLTTGQIAEKEIKVEVIIPPKVQQMTTVSVIEGETASAKCIATGKPPPKYAWTKLRESKDLSKTDRFGVNANTGDLIITRVEFYDDDKYRCVAENNAGRDEAIVKIDVLVKPKIYELLNVTTPVRGETKLVCKVQGRPTPRVLFRKLSQKEPFVVGQQKADRRIILEQKLFEEKGEAFGTLSISNLSRADDGLYECVADNTAGTGYKNGHIAVEFPPTFERTRRLPQAWAWGSRPGNLTCIPEAIPNATIVWKFNGLEIAPDSPNFLKQGNGPTSSLIVKPFNNPRFYTNYECVAANKHGQASIFLKLREAKVPEFISQIRVRSITATTIKYGIEPPPYFDGLPIKSFTVQYKPDREPSWDYARNYTWSFQAPYILEDLLPERTYHFRFAARNEVGLGPWTNAESQTMPRRSEPSEPKIMAPSSHVLQEENGSNRQETIVVSPYSDHFELRWSVPSENGDPIDEYLIRFCIITKVNGEWRDSECSEEIKQSYQHNSYELNALRPDTVYKIELRAHNAIGASSPAQIRVKTARGTDPPVPYNEPSITNVAIIGIVAAGIFVVLLVVDLICFCVNRAGILAFLRNRNKSKQQEDDSKLGRGEETEPLKGELNGDKRNMSVEYDGMRANSKSGEIIGKHSAV